MYLYTHIQRPATRAYFSRCIPHLRRETAEGAQLFIPNTCQLSHFTRFAPCAPGRNICHAAKHGKPAMHRLGPQDHEHSASTDHCPSLVRAGGFAHIVAKAYGASAPVDLAVGLHLVARRSRPRGPRQAARVGQRLSRRSRRSRRRGYSLTGSMTTTTTTWTRSRRVSSRRTSSLRVSKPRTSNRAMPRPMRNPCRSPSLRRRRRR